MVIANLYREKKMLRSGVNSSPFDVERELRSLGVEAIVLLNLTDPGKPDTIEISKEDGVRFAELLRDYG
jgi:hypothetical protein